MDNIKYRLEGFELTQYIMRQELFDNSREADVESEMSFSYNSERNILRNTLSVALSQDGNTFLSMQIDTFVSIVQESADIMIHDGTVTIPKILQCQAVSFGYGALRGIMYLKTVNTPLCTLVLPPLVVHSVIKSDISIEVNSKGY